MVGRGGSRKHRVGVSPRFHPKLSVYIVPLQLKGITPCPRRSQRRPRPLQSLGAAVSQSLSTIKKVVHQSQSTQPRNVYKDQSHRTNQVLLRRDEIAELLGISLASVVSLCKSGQLRSIKLGRAVRVHVDDLSAFAKKGTENRTVNGEPLDRLWQGKQAQ